jgi:hypothetical protein
MEHARASDGQAWRSTSTPAKSKIVTGVRGWQPTEQWSSDSTSQARPQSKPQDQHQEFT